MPAGPAGGLAVKASVISPERILFEGDVSSVVAPAFDGEVGILARHAPMVALLGRGTLRLTDPGGGVRRFDVSGGFLQVVDDVVRVVTESATPTASAGQPGR